MAEIRIKIKDRDFIKWVSNYDSNLSNALKHGKGLPTEAFAKLKMFMNQFYGKK